MAAKAEDWEGPTLLPPSTRQYSLPEDCRETKEEKVPLATFPSPIPGQCNETADRQDLEANRVLTALAAAAVSVVLEPQDLEPLPFPLDDPDDLAMVEVPLAPHPPPQPPQKGRPPPPRKGF